MTKAERHRVAYEMSLPWLDKKFQHEAVLSHFELRRGALYGLVHTGMSDLEDIDAVTKIMREEGVHVYGQKTAIQWGKENDGRVTSVSTRLHEAQEQEFMQLMKAAAFDKSGAIQPGLLRHKLDTSGLDFSDAHGKAQREAIERVGIGGRFGLILAAAGAGKTASLKGLVAAWDEMQRDVWGASLGWRQADDLADAGIKGWRVKAFSVLIDGMQSGSIRLTDNSVVAIDEWGLLGTRQGLELLRYQQKLGFSIVALGDPKQCGSIEAGDIIDLSRRALGNNAIPMIETTVRQKGREAQISGLLRKGEARQALEMKLEDKTAEMVYGGRDGVIRRTAELYAERLKETGQAPTISAPTNADAHQISVAVRHERRKMGLVGAQDLMTFQATDGTREYSLSVAKGDKVRLFESTKATLPNGRVRSIGRNGNVVEVLDADRSGLTVRNKDDKVGLIRWETLSKHAGGRGVKLAYGDSLTIYSAQGSTSREHIFTLPNGSGEITAYTAYSAATRHKERAYLLTSEVAERTAVRVSRPVNSIHEITLADKWANVAKRLSYQPRRDTATAMRERVGKVKIGAFDTTIAMHTPADPRLRKRDAPSRAAENGPDVVQQRNLSDIFTAIADTARQVMTHYRERSQGISR
jgi:hypothetical protein